MNTVVICVALGALAAPSDARDAAFEPVARLLVSRCLECHNAGEAAGGLTLASGESLRRGGDSGAVVDAAAWDNSLLWQRVEAGEMPPEKQGRPQQLAADELATLRRWLRAGADWPAGRTLDLYEFTTDGRAGRDWWSLQPIARPALPAVKDGEWPANAIDRFILARLESEGLRPAPAADRRTLIRRLWFDVVGLPPPRDDVERFVNDRSSGAYHRLVDRLLASPHYGERWGRYWLDLVRYAETCGYERDQVKPEVWRYRDWVIQSLNDDQPYDRFVHEQLAGDELADRNRDTVIATAFLRLGTWNDEPNDPQEYKYERLEDMVHATATAFLGLTVKCARCHDHKFDPIPQVDYYRLAAAFWAGPIEPGDRGLLGGPTAEQLGYDVFGWTDRARDPPPLRLLKSGDPKRPAQEVPPGHLSLIPRLDRPLTPADAAAGTSQRRRQLAQWITDPANPLTPRVIVNRLWQHHFGQGLVRSPNNFGFRGEPPTHPELLDWLAAELTAGRPGSDASPGGRTPWTLKRIHRLMLLSSTYRQSSDHPRHDEYARRDFGNRWWWRAERRRLDAEALRDAMLASAGQLDLRIKGPSFRPEIPPEALEGLSRKAGAWTASPETERRRRSVYIFTQRSLLVPLMTVFDFADTNLPCGQRDVTTVAPQALALLNNDFVHRQSRSLAERVASAAGHDPRRQVATAWQLALGRGPSETEVDVALQHLEAQQNHFARQAEDGSQPPPGRLPVSDALALHLRAAEGVDVDAAGRVEAWHDLSPAGRTARQEQAAARPERVSEPGNGRSLIRFDGEGDFLRLTGQVLQSPRHTVVAVVTDRAADGHREIFSNWNGAAGNSTTSVFLGLTGEDRVRFTDDFSPAAALRDRHRLFILTAVAGSQETLVYQNRQLLGRLNRALSPRNLTPPYVIGQQGNIDGEFWRGELAELIVYDGELSADQCRRVWEYLDGRYGLELREPRPDPRQLALESLCQVLLSSNEFFYID